MDNLEYLSEAFDVFNRIAGIRSSKKVTGPALERIFKKLERVLDQYYNQAEEVLKLQLDMLGSNLKTFDKSRFGNLDHVRELKTNYEQTKKSLQIIQKLKQNFKDAKGKAYDFQFNADKSNALNVQSLEDAIKNIITNTEENEDAAEKEVKSVAAKEPTPPAAETPPEEEPVAAEPEQPKEEPVAAEPEQPKEEPVVAEPPKAEPAPEPPKVEPAPQPEPQAPPKAETPPAPALPKKATPESEVERKPGILKLDGTTKKPTLYVEKVDNNPDKLRLYKYNKDGTSTQGLIDKAKLGEYLRNNAYDLTAFNTWLVPQRQQF